MKSLQVVADLHNHSTASDGEYSPAELVSRGRDLGLQAIGLTDHDNIAGLDEFYFIRERIRNNRCSWGGSFIKI